MSEMRKNDENNSGKYQFEKLSLNEDLDISVYKDAIDFAFANPDIKNIAISGAYGSGKSSVLASYKKQSEKKFVHISLAHFVPEKKENSSILTPNSVPANKTDTVALEGKILNQLIHQLDVRKIPQTNFRVKNTMTLQSVIQNSTAIITLVVCFLHLVLSYTWINFVGTFEASGFRSFLELFTTPLSFLFSGIIIFIISAIYIYSAVKTQRYNAAIRKLSLQGNEIEIFEDKNDSFFDKYLNEVLYLFENSDIDAIVFEDMDRYEMEAIFERLREVNTLVNIRLMQKKKSPIRFFFLLRDDIFVSKDRTKFFDFIIPIVPVIDSSNSYDKLITHLEKNKIRSDFSDGFLQGISLYIDDMRLLKNICNEYLIYHSRLGFIDLDSEKLLAIITYKNIYPHDFGLLQNNLGYVHAVFANKPTILQDQLDNLENEHLRLSELEEAASVDMLKSRLEIMRIFAVMYLSEYTSNLRNMSESVLDSHLRRVLSGNQLKEYEARINLASSQRQEEIREGRKEIACKILSLKGMKLYEIIPREDGVKILSAIEHTENGTVHDYREIKSSQYFDLLKYLILNGYLDESYPDYMTYFYPNSLTRKDKIFLRRILDRNGCDYTYCLDNPHLVVSKLRATDFDYVEVLNNDLLNYLLKGGCYSEKLQHLLAQIEKKREFRFLRQFLESTSERKLFIQAFSKQWPGFFNDVIRNGGLSSEEIRQYSIDALYYCDDEQLSTINRERCLTGYIDSSPDYLQISDPQIEKLIHAFVLLDVHFRSINYDVSNSTLFEQVYQASLYSINLDNINLMLKKMHGVETEDTELLSSNYSYISSVPQSPLYYYIDGHIDDYMGVRLTTYLGKIKDLELDVIKLLNDERISQHFKQDYIAQLGTTISDLQTVNDKNLWEHILEKKCVAHTERNIVAYWGIQNKVDPVLVGYINDFHAAIDFRACKDTLGETDWKNFFVNVVKCNDIQNRQYENCVVSMGIKWDNEFNVTDLSVDKVNILAKNHVLPITPTTLRFLRNNYVAAIYAYIESNFDEYANIMTPQLINQQELLVILKWDVSDESKKKLIDMAPSPISIIDKKYNPTIGTYILQKKLNSGDIPILYETYDEQPDLIKDYVYSHAIRNVDSVINGTTKTTVELKCRILKDNQISASVKQRLLVAVIKILTREDVILCLEAANKSEFSKVFNSRTKPKIENNSYNKEILDVFKSREWVIDYVLNADNSGYEIQRPTQSRKRVMVNV